MGRKSILLIGDFFCILTLLILTILGYEDLKEPSKYFILLFMFSFGISLGPVVWFYLPEILPEKGVSVAALANWLFCGIIGFGFPLVNKSIQIQGCFLIFLICCVASFFFVLFFVKETKGKKSHEIEEMFLDKSKQEKEDEGKRSLLSQETA
jgi:MFS family permease